MEISDRNDRMYLWTHIHISQRVNTPPWLDVRKAAYQAATIDIGETSSLTLMQDMPLWVTCYKAVYLDTYDRSETSRLASINSRRLTSNWYMTVRHKYRIDWPSYVPLWTICVKAAHMMVKYKETGPHNSASWCTIQSGRHMVLRKQNWRADDSVNWIASVPRLGFYLTHLTHEQVRLHTMLINNNWLYSQINRWCCNIPTDVNTKTITSGSRQVGATCMSARIIR